MVDGDSERIARIDERTASMMRRLDYISDRLDDVCATQGDHAERIARVETHVGLVAGVAALLSAIAGYLGVRQ